MVANSQAAMTAKDFLAMPEDGSARELIRGELRILPTTTLPANHANAVDGIASALNRWLDRENRPDGLVVSRVSGCRLTSNSDSIVGMDVAVFFGDAALAAWELGLIFPDPPVLMVKVLAPKDTHGSIAEKIWLCQEVRVPQLWIVDPDIQTITLCRPNARIQLFHRMQSISGEPELPGFQAEVPSLFAPRSNCSLPKA